jgi:predicted ATPase
MSLLIRQNTVHLVPGVLKQTLGLDFQPDQSLSTLIRELRGKRMLLVLDVCAHIVAGAAQLATAVLGGAPDIKILATSREPLRIGAERIYRLDPSVCPPRVTAISAEEARSALRPFSFLLSARPPKWVTLP